MDVASAFHWGEVWVSTPSGGAFLAGIRSAHSIPSHLILQLLRITVIHFHLFQRLDE